MPLSEQEQRLLDEMERNLYKNEADIVETSTGPRTINFSRVALGLFVLVVGIGIVVVGVAVNLPIVGVAGFGVAVVGALLALSANRPAAPAHEADTRPGAAKNEKRPASGGLMDRLSDRWDQRHGDRDED